MVAFLARVTVLKNKIVNRKIRIEEWRPASCRCSYHIELQPSERKEIGASKFHNRCIDSGKAAFMRIFVDEKPLKILVNGVETHATLTPQDFIKYVKISFELEDGVIVMRGVEAKFSDFNRLRGLGFLLGREYQGRPAVRIL